MIFLILQINFVSWKTYHAYYRTHALHTQRPWPQLTLTGWYHDILSHHYCNITVLWLGSVRHCIWCDYLWNKRQHYRINQLGPRARHFAWGGWPDPGYETACHGEQYDQWPVAFFNKEVNPRLAKRTASPLRGYSVRIGVMSVWDLRLGTCFNV